MLEMVSAADPGLLNTMVCGVLEVKIVTLPNARLPGESAAIGDVGEVPVPVSVIVCGLPDALSVMVTAPDRDPAAVGVKVTLSAQLAEAASDPDPTGQLFVWEKSPLLVPVIEILEMVRGPVPEFVSVTPLAELVVPTA
jgi:hypothetical protein